MAKKQTDSDLVFNTLLKNPDIVLNAMTTRAGLMQRLFDPRRDIDDECGYPKAITGTQYRAMYDRELGRRVVDVYPAETWKKFPLIYEDPNPETNTPFELSLEDLNKRHRLLYYLHRIDELSGIGHYGIILWGLDDGKPLDQPVDGSDTWEETTGKSQTKTGTRSTRRLLYIRVLDESLVTVAAYETNVTSPRYGLPTKYTITLVDPTTFESGAVATPPTTSSTVHWTRITHVADNRKTSEVFGSPRMEPVWNRLYDLRKVLGGSGEMFWRGGFPGVSLETQPGLENAELDQEATRQMMFNYMNGLQRYLALTGMSAKSLAPQIADPTASFEAQVKAVCVTLGVPYRVFMGIEEGVVSGDQATRAWESRLANRQARYVTPMLIDPVLQRLVDYGVLQPTAKPMGWVVEWPPRMEPTEQEQADIAAKRTEAFSKYVAGGVDTLVPPLEFLTIICGIDEEVAMSIIAAAEERIAEEEQNSPESVHTPAPGQGQAGGVPPAQPTIEEPVEQ